MPEKERIYLTHIELHARGFRQTTHFSKVAEKGRMYSAADQTTLKKISETPESGDKYQMIISLPDDLQKDINEGRIELMIPEDGLYVFAGKDLVEFMKGREKHAHRDRVWHSNSEEV